MALVGSGAISFNAINVELGLAGTTAASLGQANFRSLAGVPSGVISLSNFYGKANTAPPITFGTSARVGTVAGQSKPLVALSNSNSAVMVSVISNPYQMVAAYTANAASWPNNLVRIGTAYLDEITGVAVSSSGRFVAYGNSSSGSPSWVGSMFFSVSTNGTSWTTTRPYPGSEVTRNLVYDSTRDRFLGISYSSTFYTSTDGTNWSARTFFGGGTPVAVSCVHCSPSGKYVSIGRRNSDGFPVFSYSADGTTWTNWAVMNAANVPTTNDSWVAAGSLACSPSGRWCAAVVTPTGTKFCTSNDGTTWTPLAAPAANFVQKYPFIDSMRCNANGLFVMAIGSGGNNQSVHYTQSIDGGVTWLQSVLLDPSPRSSNYGASISVNNNGKFVIALATNTWYWNAAYST